MLRVNQLFSPIDLCTLVHHTPPNTTHFYTPPDSTRAQFIHATDQGISTTAPEMFLVDYDLHDCPRTELKLEAFYELANRDVPLVQTHPAPFSQRHQYQVLPTQTTAPHKPTTTFQPCSTAFPKPNAVSA